MATSPAGSIAKWSSPCTSLSPPRDTQGCGWPRSSSAMVGGDARPGLVEPALAAKHQAGEDHGLRLGAALGQAALDQRLVEPEFLGPSAIAAV